jgi:hypothetical protein
MNNLADGYAALRRHADALKLREETLALMKAKLSPDHPLTLVGMSGVADSLTTLDRGAEAVSIIDDCIKLGAEKVGDSRFIPFVMDLRLRNFEKSKDSGGCRATAEMWDALNRADAASLYTAASMRAVTAAVMEKTPANTPGADSARLSKGEADRAMNWLKQAVAAGYKDVTKLKKDTDLDALREREDFKKLIADLEAKVGAEKKDGTQINAEEFFLRESA